MRTWMIICLCLLTACVSQKTIEKTPEKKKDDFQVSYQLNKEELRKAIRVRLPEIKHCYEKSLKYDPQLEGKVVVEFELKGDGQVQKCDIRSSTLKSVPVEKCICDKILEITFSTIPGDTVRVVDYPFVFTPDE